MVCGSDSESVAFVSPVTCPPRSPREETLATTTTHPEKSRGKAAQEKKGKRFLPHYWRAIDGTPLSALVSDLLDTLQANEQRQRKRSLRASTDWREAIESVACALADHELTGAASYPLVAPLANAREKPSRYAVPTPYSHGALKAAIEALEAQGVLALSKSNKRRGVASTIVATEGFRAELQSRGVTLGHFKRLPEGGELVVLSRKTRKAIEREGVPVAPPATSKERIEYADTRETRRLRTEVETLNAFLDDACLSFVDDGGAHVDVDQRTLRRHFVLLEGMSRARFDLGGRLFGAFWSNLERERRRASLRIDGEPIAEVDFNAAFPRLLYAKQGLAFTASPSPHTPSVSFDPYALPGLVNHRAGVKKALNAFLFAPGLKRLPPDIAPSLPSGMTAAKMRAAFLDMLPGLAPYLEADNTPSGEPIGFRLMFTESEILLAALASLMALGVVALPLHDAVLVRRDQAQIAKRELEAAALSECGTVLPASVKLPIEEGGE